MAVAPYTPSYFYVPEQLHLLKVFFSVGSTTILRIMLINLQRSRIAEGKILW